MRTFSGFKFLSATVMSLLIYTSPGMTSNSNEVRGHGTDWRATPDEEYYYKLKTGRRIAVFNVTRQYFSIKGDDYLERRDGHYYSEFGGRDLYCTNVEFFCIRGGIYAVVPKKMSGQTDWTFSEMSCRADSSLNERGLNLIICTFKGQSTSFEYERNRGIVSYKEDETTNEEFELIGARGLFSGN